jgi:hypothetical protein
VADWSSFFLGELGAAARRRSQQMVACNRAAVLVIAAAGGVLVWRADLAGLYLLPLGILMTFAAVGANAWVLLIEINR